MKVDLSITIRLLFYDMCFDSPIHFADYLAANGEEMSCIEGE
jgi:hypothetical protein